MFLRQCCPEVSYETYKLQQHGQVCQELVGPLSLRGLPAPAGNRGEWAQTLQS